MTDYEAAILDVDGTIVRGEELLPGATDGLRALEAAGCSRLLFSNNPTRGSAHYRETLAPHGIDVDPETVLTSATVSAEYLAATHPDQRVYLVGSDRLESILEDAAVELTTEPDEAEVVLGSFDDTFSYGTLWSALQALEGDVPFYGTDPDATVPIDDGEIPGSGAMIAAMEAVAGREPDAILGKPSSVAATAAMDRLAADPRNTLVVGDRLDTDIALGNRAGMETALVLTGVTDRADLADVGADAEPDHVLESLAAVDTLL
ncbi:HAD-superfamily hydrolase [Natrinema pellirubrum DSM 15624]|uniref:HAD-superfamily hydrolase n=1 Tax=Natrinema pellirubrum (strain DSM 15624 / CIP 106293 / JCM 10476 / NCIMB 786 / 157) TaxID=797303 RepID=L0JNR0_NATP1|nr:HAD-IIA family hydrolase [Natrinema pellirubrum]AGB32237.1 putative sugar phosphatase of HAD superfamily [Natrinema pellirubrum DSM 15624]ELY75015.1 HAD-superfamily hydrolase [Natrinema pellirubrum DSM 15624]